MHEYNLNAGGSFGGLRSLEAIMEVGLAVAALAFTAAIWLASNSGPSSAATDAMHVTLPRVVVQGAR